MKRIIFCIAVSFGLSCSLKAQFSFQFETGYNFGTDFDNPEQFNTFQISDEEERLVVMRYSFGKGISLGAGLFYQVHSNLSFGLTTSYLYGIRAKQYNSYDITGEEYDITKYRGNILRICPTARFSVNKKKYQLFLDFGLMAGVLGSVNIKIAQYDEDDILIQHFRYTRDIPIGITSTLGLGLPLSEKSHLQFGVKSFSHAFGPRKGELLSRILNGESQLENLETYQKEAVFVEEHIYPVNGGVTDPDQPQTGILRFYPFSSIGLNIGITFTLSPNISKE